MELLAIIVLASCSALILGFIIYWVVYPVFSSPFLTSTSEDMLKMFELADLSRDDDFVDLGSGDGRVTLAASRVARKAVGIEHNPFLTIFSKFMEIISANGEVEFKNKSYFDENLSEFEVVFLYLMPNDLKNLKAKLEKELAPGTRVVTKKFKIPGWEVSKTKDKKYYLYVVGQK